MSKRQLHHLEATKIKVLQDTSIPAIGQCLQAIALAHQGRAQSESHLARGWPWPSTTVEDGLTTASRLPDRRTRLANSGEKIDRRQRLRQRRVERAFGPRISSHRDATQEDKPRRDTLPPWLIPIRAPVENYFPSIKLLRAISAL